MVSRVDPSSELIDANGYFRTPLFHGTSLYFWPSIAINGLGGLNPAVEWGGHRLHTELVVRLDQIGSHAWLAERKRSAARLKLMADDANKDRSSGHSNFRYGGTYLSGCPLKAATYGSRGFGSELLREAAKLLGLLRAEAPADADRLLSEFAEVARCLDGEHLPVLIEVDRVHVSEIRMENGSDARKQICEDEARLRALPIKVIPSMEGYCFEAVQPFSPNRLKPRLITSQMSPLGFLAPHELTTSPLHARNP